MQISKFIDHTLLKADATGDQIEKLCNEARQYQFFSVCVNSYHVANCVKLLSGSDVKVCTVVGFPLGAMSTKAKAFETQQAIQDGADEIDMVINIGALKDRKDEIVFEDIRSVVQAANHRTVKVIIETSLINNEEKMRACQLSVKAGAHFVKTCTGFAGGGATIEDIELMKNTVAGKSLVKASGGIKDIKLAKALIEAGADRLGTSSGVSLVLGLQAEGGY